MFVVLLNGWKYFEGTIDECENERDIFVKHQEEIGNDPSEYTIEIATDEM